MTSPLFRNDHLTIDVTSAQMDVLLTVAHLLPGRIECLIEAYNQSQIFNSRVGMAWMREEFQTWLEDREESGASFAICSDDSMNAPGSESIIVLPDCHYDLLDVCRALEAYRDETDEELGRLAVKARNACDARILAVPVGSEVDGIIITEDMKSHIREAAAEPRFEAEIAESAVEFRNEIGATELDRLADVFRTTAQAKEDDDYWYLYAISR